MKPLTWFDEGFDGVFFYQWRFDLEATSVAGDHVVVVSKSDEITLTKDLKFVENSYVLYFQGFLTD